MSIESIRERGEKGSRIELTRLRLANEVDLVMRLGYEDQGTVEVEVIVERHARAIHWSNESRKGNSSVGDVNGA